MKLANAEAFGIYCVRQMKAWLEPTRTYALPSFLFLGYMSTLWMVLAFIPIYLTDLGFSHLQIGILISTFPLASLILMFPFGIFSDRLSPKKLIIVGFAMMAIFFLGLRYAGGFWSHLALFVLAGTGGALFRVSLFSLYYKFLGEQNKGAKLGIFMGVGLLGYGLGPFVGGFLFLRVGLDSLLLISTLLVVGGALFNYCLVSLQGNSMEPALRHGDALWTKRVDPAELKIGNIVILRHSSLGWMTHRVINIQPSRKGYLLETKGDANRIVERSEIEVNGTVRVSLVRIRYAGYVLEFLGSIDGIVLVGLTALVIAIYVHRGREVL